MSISKDIKQQPLEQTDLTNNDYLCLCKKVYVLGVSTRVPNHVNIKLLPAI